MMFNCGQMLKLISFHHVYHDNRKLIRTIEKLGPESQIAEENVLNLPKDVYDIAMTYPRNLTLCHFVRFLVAPTCCYQFVYPTNKSIRWTFVFQRICEFTVCNFLVL